ncbi:MAG: helix-hairpin-helix domain-containing protein, partial [Gammaproteobacteria bacterium]|nr:helix-hairpin-helix domain-containing protein [Gammaproteobacteria bacterium]
SLEGIDMVKAREIVSYREMFGRFRSVDELIEVQGIGEATVEKNRHRIVIVNN